MNNILILYPKLFLCRQKFERKISRIISRLSDYKIIYPFDYNNFIEESPTIVSKQKLLHSEWENIAITHAIIFDDGNEFPSERNKLIKNNALIRDIKIQITRVVNIKYKTEYKGLKSTNSYEYIGRGSYWGNNYSMFESGEDREDVIRKYKYDFDKDLFIDKSKSEVHKIAGKILGCFCKPENCHGDILADYLNKFDDGK